MTPILMPELAGKILAAIEARPAPPLNGRGAAEAMKRLAASAAAAPRAQRSSVPGPSPRHLSG